MAVHEIRVFHTGPDDPLAGRIGHQAEMMFGEQPDVATAQLYLVEGVSNEQAWHLARELLTDPVIQHSEVGKRSDWSDPNIVEVGYRPGTQDPQAGQISLAAGFLGIATAAVATASRYNFGPETSPPARDQVVHGLLVNKTVQLVLTASPETLRIDSPAPPAETIPLRQASIAELEELSRARSLHMIRDDLITVQAECTQRGTDPTDVELEFIAGRRSDHCAHLTFGAPVIDRLTGHIRPSMFTRLKDTAQSIIDRTPNVISAFHDNAGVLRFYAGYAIAIKKESHNSPSAVEPYGGGGTGTGGVIRDILGCGLGFRPVLLDNFFAFAPADYSKDALPAGCLPPDYLRQRVVDGTRDYGNRTGIPTGSVTIYADPDFRAKPTVLAGAYGIAPEAYARKGQPQVGDRVITIGGRTGRDGLHGATFSSSNMTAETATINASSVQIGDPIQEKNVMDALLELRDAGLIRALTDCGAAGYGSAVGELGEGTGVTINLDRIPVKYAGLAPWELLMSESQERMVLAVNDDPATQVTLASIMAKHDVEWADIGYFDGTNQFSAWYGDKRVAHLDYEFLNSFSQRPRLSDWQPPERAERHPQVQDWTAIAGQVMGHDNVCSQETVIGQYDHMVQGTMVLPPYGGVAHDIPNDGVVLMPLRDELPDAYYGLVHAHAANPAIMRIDPHLGALGATAEAMAKFVAIGGAPFNDENYSVALMNNYVWPTPEDPQTFGSLERAVEGVNTAQITLDIPVVSGKDSVSSRYKGTDDTTIDIPPVLDMTVVGGIPDARKTVSADIKQPGSTLVLVGTPDYEAMGGSVFYEVADGESSRVPLVDVRRLPATLRQVHTAIQTGKVLSASAISRGGLLATVTKMAIGGQAGVALHFDETIPLEQHLFNETAGCLVVEVADPQAASDLFGSVPHTIIGTTTRETEVRASHGNTAPPALAVPLRQLRNAWKQPMEQF